MAIIVGNNQNNVIEGTPADEVILAGGGSDTINAGGGDDLVVAGSGDDTVDAGDGNDVVLAGSGDDTVNAGSGDDLVVAGSGDDTIDGGEGNDVVFAGGGNDTVIHVEGDNLDAENWYFGGKGMDTLRLVVSAETLLSDEFQDELAAFQAMIDAGGSAEGYFSTLGIYISSFEAIEVVSDNLAPTSIALSNAAVLENSPGAVIGILSATDPNGDAGLVFSLDAGSRYEIVDGTTLKLRDDVSLDREAPFFPPAPSAVVTVTDPGGLTYTQVFPIEVLDVDEPPQTPIPFVGELAPNVFENQPGAVFRSFSARDPEGGALTWQVSDDRFEIVQANSVIYDLKLKAGISLDYETEPNVTVTATATDPGGLSRSRTFNLDVHDAPPTEISLDNATVDENVVGGEIGNLIVTDPDGDTEFVFFVNDSRFEVVDGALKLVDGESLDFETEPTVSVAVTAAGDDGVLGFTETFEIMVEDVNEAPTAIALDNANVDENAVGAEVGNLIVTDPDGDTEFVFSVNDPRFEVVDGVLKLVDGESLDFETEPTVSVAVTAAGDNAVGGFTEFFNITVNDVNEAPEIVRPTAVEAALIAAVLGQFPELGLAQIVIDPGSENAPGDTFGILNVSDPDGGALTVELSDSRFEAVPITELATPGAVIPPELEPVLSTISVVKLKDDQTLDHEAEPSVPLTATVTDAGGLMASTTFSVGVEDVNEAPQIVRPTGLIGALQIVVITNLIASFPELGLLPVVIDPGLENTPGAAFGFLLASDPDGGGLTVALSDSRFEAVPIVDLVTPGAEIPPEVESVFSSVYVVKLKDDQMLDHEAEPSVPLTATVTDAGGLSASTTFSVGVEDVNEAPTAIALDGDAILDDTPGAVVGAVTVTDPDGDLIFDYEVSDDRFEVVGGVLKLKDTESLDFVNDPTVSLDVTATDPGDLSFTQAFVIDVIDVPEVAV